MALPRVYRGGRDGVEGRSAEAKLAFFAGAELDPVPPVDSKDPREKAVHVHGVDDPDEVQLLRWFGQAADIPGGTP